MLFTKKIVVIEEGDILWRFYCKNFQLTKRPMVSPRNFCQYFWSSVGGFLFWTEKEVNLRKTWLLGFCLFSLALLIGVLNGRFWKSPYIDKGSITILLSSVFLAGIPTAFRILDWFDRVPKRTRPIVILGILLALSLTIWLDRSLLGLIAPLVYFSGFVVLTIVLVYLMFLFPKIRYRLPKRLLEVFETFRAYIVSVKDKVCLEVRAPQPQSTTRAD